MMSRETCVDINSYRTETMSYSYHIIINYANLHGKLKLPAVIQLASSLSYLVIMVPNLYTNLTKSDIWSSWGLFELLAYKATRSHIVSLLASIHMIS